MIASMVFTFIALVLAMQSLLSAHAAGPENGLYGGRRASWRPVLAGVWGGGLWGGGAGRGRGDGKGVGGGVPDARPLPLVFVYPLPGRFHRDLYAEQVGAEWGGKGGGGRMRESGGGGKGVRDRRDGRDGSGERRREGGGCGDG